MLTRLRVSNFKTFDDLDVNLDPLTVIVGPNAAGKSNLFDAIALLSACASRDDVATALNSIRGEYEELFGDPDLPIQLEADLLLNPTVTDAFGERHYLKDTRLRYTVEIGLSATQDRQRPYVRSETVERIPRESDPLERIIPKGSQLSAHRSTHKPYLRMENRADGPFFIVSQDGSQGRNREIPARQASVTVLSTSRDRTFLHLFAVAEELRSWRFLQLDPGVLRLPSSDSSAGPLRSTGENLAAVIGRLDVKSSANSIAAEIARELSLIISGIRRIVPEFDEARRHWELFFEASDGDRRSARVVSDGTLRMTALLAELLDPLSQGTLCFEEPENGVHPARIKPLMDLLASHTTHLEASNAEPPLRQVLVNSHSPLLVEAMQDLKAKSGVLFADRVRRVGGGLPPRSITRLRPVASDNVLDTSPDDVVPPSEVAAYLGSRFNDEVA